MESYPLPLAIFAATLAGMVAWNLVRRRFSEKQLEELDGSPLLRILGYALLLIIIAAMISLVVRDLRSI